MSNALHNGIGKAAASSTLSLSSATTNAHNGLALRHLRFLHQLSQRTGPELNPRRLIPLSRHPPQLSSCLVSAKQSPCAAMSPPIYLLCCLLYEESSLSAGPGLPPSLLSLSLLLPPLRSACLRLSALFFPASCNRVAVLARSPSGSRGSSLLVT